MSHRAPWWLPAALVFALGFGLSLVQPSCAMHRDIRLRAMRSLVELDLTHVGDPLPSIEAAQRLMLDPRARIYADDLSAGSAFIYPPIAALLYRPLATLSPDEAEERLVQANHILFAVVVALVVQLAAVRRRAAPWLVAGGVAASAIFYPLVHAVELNQSTLLVTALLGGTWVALDQRRPALAGVLFALTLGVKPQLVLVLPLMVWHARRLVAGALIASVPLAAASVAYAGIANHVDYVTRVLPSLSRGYAYYANEGFNGFYNRLVPGVDISSFRQPPASPVVGALTLATAIVVLGATGWLLRRWHGKAGTEPTWALAIAWLATTLVSPVAWQHHFAPALFVFVLVARAFVETPPLRRTGLALLAGAAFTLMASYFEVRSLEGVAARLLASYVLYGALALGATLGLASEARAARR